MSRPAYDYEPVAGGVEDVTTTPGTRVGDARVVTLVRRLADETATLFTKELALLKVETTNAIRDTRSGVASIATGGAVLYAGFLFLLLAAYLGLSLVLEEWLAALIVGGVVALIGAIMLSSGKKKLDASSFKPEQTQAALQKDREMIKRNVHEPHQR
ncbi:MAG: phage holin family protein [Gammaproteobacteria bacterium]